MKEEIQYYNGQVDFSWERDYDDKGNKTFERRFKRRDIMYALNWKYEYDKNGNWIKKTHYDAYGGENLIEERTIVYY